MGNCMACNLSWLQKNEENIDKTINEVRKLMVELSEKKDLIFVGKPFEEPLTKQRDFEFMNDNNKEDKENFELFDFEEISSEHSSDFNKSEEFIAKTITIPKKCRETKSKKKESNLSQKTYDQFANYSTNLNVGHDCVIEDSSYHRTSKNYGFISNPLSYEDVNEVLNEPETISSSIYPITLESSLINKEANINQQSESIINLVDDYQNVTIIDKNVFPMPLLPWNSNIGQTKSFQIQNNSMQCEDYFSNKIKDKNDGRILNAVPPVYDVFKKIQKKENQHFMKPKNANDKTSKKARELFSLLFRLNEYQQNIIHQLVLCKNYDGTRTILECLAQLNLSETLLNVSDFCGNVAFSHALIAKDVEMIKIFLSFGSKIPKYCHLKSKSNWIPTLHLLFKTVNENDKENVFTLICNYLPLHHEKEEVRDILETKNNEGLTILHYIISQYSSTSPTKTMSLAYINFLVQIGASLETKCPCPSHNRIKVDALAQAIFSNCPLEILNNFLEFPHIKNINFLWDYVIENISYKLEELLLLRVDINPKSKEEIITLLKNFK